MSDAHYFKSRRNRVWREGERVYKKYGQLPGENTGGPLRRAAYEADMLTYLHCCGVPVPKVYSCAYDLLVMEYIDGITLADFIEQNEAATPKMEAGRLAREILHWFDAFYSAMQKGSIRGDVNCRNFLIMQHGNIVGVDFETAHSGYREKDLGRLMAYILTYRPEYTPYKIELSDLLLEGFTAHFGLNPKLAILEKGWELDAMNDRRVSSHFGSL